MTEERDFIAARLAGRAGRFLDVGAYDGVTDSLTRVLFEAGWSGVLVEPDPRSFLALFANYGPDIPGAERVELVAAAVLPDAGLARFWICEDQRETSTAAERFRDSFARTHGANYRRAHWLHGLTPEALLAAFPGEFRFLNVDAEGFSCELFARLLSAGVSGLELACVERDHQRQGLARDAAAAAGLKPVLETEVNLLFGREDG